VQRESRMEWVGGCLGVSVNGGWAGELVGGAKQAAM